MTDINWKSDFKAEGKIESGRQGLLVGSMTTMPTASADYEGLSIQYLGTSIPGSYQFGNFYKCTNTGTTYEWTVIGGGGGSSVAWTQIATDGDTIATITIGGVPTSVKTFKYIKDLGNETHSGQPYHIPFNINPIVYAQDKLSTTFDTITLDGNKTVVSYPIQINGADIGHDLAGLYTKALADLKANVTQLSDGSVTKVGTTSIGSSANPIWLDNGTPKQCSGNIGSANKPIYINAGTFTEGTYALGNVSELSKFISTDTTTTPSDDNVFTALTTKNKLDAKLNTGNDMVIGELKTVSGDRTATQWKITTPRRKLDNSGTTDTQTFTIEAMDSTNDLAGLYTKALADSKVDVEKVVGSTTSKVVNHGDYIGEYVSDTSSTSTTRTEQDIDSFHTFVTDGVDKAELYVAKDGAYIQYDSETGNAPASGQKLIRTSIVDENDATNTIDNQKAQNGCVMQTLLSDNDTIISFNTASENGVSGILGQVYAKSLASNNGMRINFTKSGAYYGVGTSTPTDTAHEIAVKGDLSEITLNGTITQTPSFYAPTTVGLAGQFYGTDGTTPGWKSIASALNFKGSCTQAELTAKTPNVGDVWSVSDLDYTNFAGNGSSWDNIGKSIDMSPYQTKDVGNYNMVLISDSAGMITTSGITASTLNMLYGLTDNVQTQLDEKQQSITGGASTIVTVNLPVDKVLISNGIGKVTASSIMTTELNYLSGVSSGIQAQIDDKVTKNYDITAGTKCKITYDAKGLVRNGADLTELDIPTLQIAKIDGLQDALNDKVVKNAMIMGATKCKITYDAKGLVTAGADLSDSDIPNLASSKITAMTSYAKAIAESPIAPTDTLNGAIGKVEYAVGLRALSSALTDGSVTKVGTVTIGDTNRICYLANGVPTAGISITYGTTDPTGVPPGGVGSIYIKYSA